MSRSASSVAVAVLLLFALLATFSSAAPANIVRGMRRDGEVDSTNSTNTTDNTDYTNPNSTNSGGSTSNLATSASGAGAMSGRATWYDPGLGACGGYNTASDFIVALSEANWDGGSHCGQQIQLTNSANGKSCTVTVRDMCPGCGYGSLDLSPAVFSFLDGNLGDGVFAINWYFG